MATTFYPTGPLSDIDPTAADDKVLSLSRGAGLAASTTNTVAGPTAGVQVTVTAGGTAQEWYSNPLDAVTISGTITLNLWMAENNMSANVGAQVIIERCDGAGNVISTIVNTEKGTEVPVTTRAAQNWTATPTSTALSAGDRLRVRVLGNDVGTMASGFTFSFGYAGTSAAADGDSFVTFTEAITEQAAGPERVPRFTPYPQLLAH